MDWGYELSRLQLHFKIGGQNDCHRCIFWKGLHVPFNNCHQAFAAYHYLPRSVTRCLPRWHPFYANRVLQPDLTWPGLRPQERSGPKLFQAGGDQTFEITGRSSIIAVQSGLPGGSYPPRTGWWHPLPPITIKGSVLFWSQLFGKTS